MNFEDLLGQLSDLDSEVDDDDDSPAILDLEEIRKNLPTYDVKRLCEMIVCDRYFSLNNEIGIMCMEELARRRTAGEVFDFESYIESAYKELPVLNLGGTDLRSMLGQMVSEKIK